MKPMIISTESLLEDILAIDTCKNAGNNEMCTSNILL